MESMRPREIPPVGGEPSVEEGRVEMPEITLLVEGEVKEFDQLTQFVLPNQAVILQRMGGMVNDKNANLFKQVGKQIAKHHGKTFDRDTFLLFLKKAIHTATGGGDKELGMWAWADDIVDALVGQKKAAQEIKDKINGQIKDDFLKRIIQAEAEEQQQ